MSRPHPNQSKPNEEIQRLCREAQESWKRQDYQRGIVLMEQAIRRQPSNPGLHFNLALAHGRRYDFPAAERCLEKALRVSNGRVQILEEAARICSSFTNLDFMLRYLERASRKKGVSINALTSLADIYIVDDRLDEAAEVVERAAQLDRKDPRVLVREAVLKRQRGQIKEAESRFRDLMMNSAADTRVRVRAAYALADLLDGAGQYDEAMTALLEAKAIQRPEAAPLSDQLQQMQNLLKGIPQTITATVLDRWRTDAARLDPPRRLALLTGHPRSGTTLLEQVLDAHSDVAGLEETDLIYDEIYQPLTRDFPPGTGFFQMLDSSPPSVLSRLRENYFHCAEMLLGRPLGGRLLVDKNPGVNFLIAVLLRFFPETKILIALRDPRDVVISCFMQSLRRTPANFAYVTLEGTVHQYASVMGFWLEMLPRMGNKWMYVRYEQMVSDLPAVARSVLQFLGLEFEDSVLKFFERARAKRIISVSRPDVRKPVYRTAVGRWKNYGKYLEPYMPALDRFLKEFKYAS